MKMLGVIGGVSPESTALYYRLLNEAAREKLGGEHSANLMIYALDYGVMIKHYNARDWNAFTAEVVAGAERLAAAGVQAIVISSNTTHIAAEAVAERTGLPVLHMLDALGEAMTRAGVNKPLLMGTPVVMGEAHYRSELTKRYAGNVLVPTEAQQLEVGRIILDELVNGVVRSASRAALLEIIANSGADSVILGCTELCMILSADHCDIPVFDTTALHVKAASQYAFSEA
ncbi:amino acid racemase [Hyphococcus flavus]|uniref:Amino acid racemase n=1 Tax=Hyphococcus flavus TaxID=1866326 RepID=A0AAE9ZF26_9PROT|nr:amino acid racemase [Hyphococcus flavus]WDI31502.1 amino acid racemase [Hyphococcus flavus]